MSYQWPVLIQGGVVTIGSSRDASIQVSHEKILPQHCAISIRSGRLFCRCNVDQVQGDDDGLGLGLGVPTHVYMEGSQLRAGVDYMVPPNAKICFGEDGGVEYVIAEFDEASSSGQEAMSEMLMKGMASKGSKDVQDALGRIL